MIVSFFEKKKKLTTCFVVVVFFAKNFKLLMNMKRGERKVRGECERKGSE